MAAAFAAASRFRARGVKCSNVGRSVDFASCSASGPANRLCTACLVTPTAAVNEVAQQSVGGLLEVGCCRRGDGELTDGVVGLGVPPDRVDEFLQRWWRRHASTLG